MKCILLHGLGQTPPDWNATIQHMGNTLDVICPPLYDWLPETEPDYASLYQGLTRYCEQFSGPFVLGGLSLGGILALQYAAEHESRISALILMGTQFAMPKKLLIIQNMILRILPGAAFKAMPVSRQSMIRLCHSMMDLNFSQTLGDIRCKTLVLCGERDKANLSASLQLKTRITGAEFVLLFRAGHEVNKDAPGELGQVIRSFCEGA